MLSLVVGLRKAQGLLLTDRSLEAGMICLMDVFGRGSVASSAVFPASLVLTSGRELPQRLHSSCDAHRCSLGIWHVCMQVDCVLICLSAATGASACKGHLCFAARLRVSLWVSVSLPSMIPGISLLVQTALPGQLCQRMRTKC
jgi:hypothetical protein